MIDWRDFEAWMREERYRDSTIRTGIPDARRFVREASRGRTPASRLAYAGNRLDAYAQDRGLELPDELQEAIEVLHRERRRSRRGGRQTRTRKYPAESMTDSEWCALWAEVLADQSPQARVLEVMMATGLRIGDVLRITRASLTQALKTGVIRLEQKGGAELVRYIDGAPDAWGRLLQAWQGQPSSTVALFIAPEGDGSTRAGDGPYKRVRRRLLRLAKKAGVETRVHTHRLRRTVGVQALRVTDNVQAVQQLLGHKNLNTTIGYVNEARPERVAELQRQIGRFREEDGT